jgi:predicted nicotinamide N-methyase
MNDAAHPTEVTSLQIGPYAIRIVTDSKNIEHSIRLDAESDLIPGIYEGGLKIWECSIDLAHFLCTFDIPFSPKHILELGCGHGIPTIIAMKLFSAVETVVLSDFNAEVLKHKTWPNIILNDVNNPPNVIRCFGGDWELLSSKVFIETPSSEGEIYSDISHQASAVYDLILTAETLYSSESLRKVFHLHSWRILVLGKFYPYSL